LVLRAHARIEPPRMVVSQKQPDFNALGAIAAHATPSRLGDADAG